MSIDMAKMKTEVQAARAAQGKLTLRERAIAALPRLAPLAGKLPALANLPRAFPGLLERTLKLSAKRKFPAFQKPFKDTGDGEVLLFADTFTRHFDPETLHAAKRVIESTGATVGTASAPGRPLCCGRSYLSAGLTDKARAEMTRAVSAFRKALNSGKTIVGLEPSCTLMFRDEVVNLIPEWTEEMGTQILTFAEYMTRNPIEGLSLPVTSLVHGHCHQKAMGVAGATVEALGQMDGMEAQMIDSSCCGMAGPFGYQAETEEVSRKMAELSLAPAVRAASATTLIVADGFSCRCQIKDTTGREAKSLAVVLDRALRHG